MSPPLAPPGPGPDRSARLHLNCVDHTEKILELGIGLAQDAHTAEIANIALKVAAGVEREDIALRKDLIGWCAIEAGAGADQAILEGQAAVDLLSP